MYTVCLCNNMFEAGSKQAIRWWWNVCVCACVCLRWRICHPTSDSTEIFITAVTANPYVCTASGSLSLNWVSPARPTLLLNGSCHRGRWNVRGWILVHFVCRFAPARWDSQGASKCQPGTAASIWLAYPRHRSSSRVVQINISKS